MESPFNVFSDCAATTKKSLKQDRIMALSDLEKRLFIAALDPMRVYHVTASSVTCVPHNKISDELAAETLLNLLDRLHNRIVTGNEALKDVNNTLKDFSDLAFDWSVRILDKNLRCGVDTTFIKAHPGSYVTFEVQLCDKWEGDSVAGWVAQPKYDGLRCIAFPVAGAYQFFTRKGKPLYGINHVGPQLLKLGSNLVWDGEMGCSKDGVTVDFTESIHQAKTKDNKEEALNFYVFDVMTVDDWTSRKSKPLYERMKLLASVFKDAPVTPNVVPVESQIVGMNKNDPDKIIDSYIAKSFEGAVFKDPKSKYEWKRTDRWVKGKRMDTLDLPIIGAIEGRGRLTGTLGAYMVTYKGITSEVGTGLDDLDRNNMWQQYLDGKLIGQIAEVSYQNITSDNRLRFPVHKKLRSPADKTESD